MVRQTKKPLIRQAPSRKSGGSLGQRRCLVDPSLDRLGADDGTGRTLLYKLRANSYPERFQR
jgi:hypothetical protein